MNEQPLSMMSSQRLALQGLPLRLIQDGLLDEKAALQALQDSKEANTSFVSHLVAKGLADPREIAIAASQEFGVPLLDLDSIQPDLDIVKLVSDKLLQKHRVLPLLRRGKLLLLPSLILPLQMLSMKFVSTPAWPWKPLSLKKTSFKSYQLKR